jgi:cytochrome c heme-lyase
VYPSEAQFFAAMARKNHSPNAVDMKSIVPIHNAVNERAWSEILNWEAGKGGDACGGVRLVNFKGRPGDRSPKARLNTLLGYFVSVFVASICSLSNLLIVILLPLTVMTG